MTALLSPPETKYSCLAPTLQDQGKLEEAEEPTRRALAVWEKALGPDHPHVAIGLNNFASLLQVRGSTV